MIIRPAHEDDYEGLLDFYRSLSDEVASVFLPPGPVSPSAVRSHLDGVAEGSCISLVLDDNGVIMGHAFIQNIFSQRPMLGIGLRDCIIGCGFGTQMMERLLAIADAKPIPCTYLTVVKTNFRAQALYRRMGYVRIGPSTFREPNDSWLMERRLPGDRPDTPSR